jgi:uncharacterized protein YceK
VRPIIVALALSALVLSGCATMAKQQVRKEGEAQCKRDGKIFVERDMSSKGGLFGTVMVSGQCLGPDDPGYADAKAAKDVPAKRQ